MAWAFSRTSDNNVSSAASMTRLNVMLYTGEIVQDPLKDELIGILLTQQFNQRLPRFLPPGFPSRIKPGRSAASAMTASHDDCGQQSCRHHHLRCMER
ncbi:MAG: serine hydrolase [Chloroflexi bacterium]|nr:serine hydrolase [Chloroflexota bacterium]